MSTILGVMSTAASTIKEMWVNVLDTGSLQAPQTHANSFISGVVYLTPTHHAVFLRGPSGLDSWGYALKFGT